MASINTLCGLGPKSSAMLAALGIHTAEQFLAIDPYQLYAQLKQADSRVSLNMLYAILGAHEQCHWQEIKQQRRTEILLKLEEMGLAPKR
ncbi:TfoX/Sxy family DNA transformation protein [Undibacterium sp. LX40W]|uniref:TfoX/Sxy family DNA transformation protein n=1 Tax=Undibacterium nitidum TaxID=2762298 RepID=A0A923HNZ8_9BURK|nr:MULTISPECIES: TfoX/Sxy family DNA transformation protein [Undibacterium]MBC3881908.1 TfoX/Sxy family DNA transformation protein [Undibacterium nitidum]MBC3892095.1 TfoX/Sxy family DNA transformation protein [Undibacterium sp. LX40W]